MEVSLLVGFWHLGFFADFVNFAFFEGYAAVKDLTHDKGFSVNEDPINNQYVFTFSEIAGGLIN